MWFPLNNGNLMFVAFYYLLIIIVNSIDFLYNNNSYMGNVIMTHNINKI